LNQPALEVAKLAAAAPGPDRPWTGVASGRPFFLDEDIRRIAEKALFYARAGANVHLSGMAGSGKTSLAFHVAEALGRPVSFIAGNNWLTSTDFIGKEIGQSSVSVVDRYVQTVRRTESMSRSEWKDSVLAIAMERGHTLIYDEFTRASPEANSTLLSVLEEGVLAVTDQTSDRAYISAHPCFRVLLTSNPHDYVGVNSAPDAIMDRLLTLDVGAPSSATLAGIVALRSGIDPPTARRIVHLVEAARQTTPIAALGSMRPAILIARIAAFARSDGPLTDDLLAAISADVLAGRGANLGTPAISRLLASAL
jgi:nitric oxide reductase NorQ protein